VRGGANSFGARDYYVDAPAEKFIGQYVRVQYQTIVTGESSQIASFVSYFYGLTPMFQNESHVLSWHIESLYRLTLAPEHVTATDRPRRTRRASRRPVRSASTATRNGPD
jgi:hypothetical protein